MNITNELLADCVLSLSLPLPVFYGCAESPCFGENVCELCNGENHDGTDKVYELNGRDLCYTCYQESRHEE